MVGMALKVSGPALKGVAMFLAPVVAVLAWGAVEQRTSTRKKAVEAGT